MRDTYGGVTVRARRWHIAAAYALLFAAWIFDGDMRAAWKDVDRFFARGAAIEFRGGCN